MTTEAELKEIKTILTILAKKVEGMNKLIEERLIGCEEPLPDEIKATKEYEAAKKNKTVELIPWTKATKGT
jgi:Na+-transporting methylmalonyl-CoA/oxaloacetate decarboxylase gamma subunit